MSIQVFPKSANKKIGRPFALRAFFCFTLSFQFILYIYKWCWSYDHIKRAIKMVGERACMHANLLNQIVGGNIFNASMQRTHDVIQRTSKRINDLRKIPFNVLINGLKHSLNDNITIAKTRVLNLTNSRY